MANSPLNCPTVLRQLLRYEPETGKLFWKHRSAIWFRNSEGRNGNHACANWNSRYAGKEAFTAPHIAGYKQGTVRGVNYLAHRVIYAIVTGEWPVNEVDHQDGDRSCNKWSNLRHATRSENGQNTKIRSDNNSGQTGVAWDRRRQGWRARIHAGGKDCHLGTFDDINDAIAARKAAEIEHGFHENHGRAA